MRGDGERKGGGGEGGGIVVPEDDSWFLIKSFTFRADIILQEEASDFSKRTKCWSSLTQTLTHTLAHTQGLTQLQMSGKTTG